MQISDEEVNKHYGYIYMTTCLVNNKKYIGCHTCNANDKYGSYLGSSPDLHKDIKLYGKDKFEKTILAFAESKHELAQKEIQYMYDYNAVEDKNFYNKQYESIEKTINRAVYVQNKSTLRTTKGPHEKDTTNYNYGHYWSEEKKQALRDKFRNQHHSQGAKNPMYGKKGDKAINGQKVVMCDIATKKPLKVFATKLLILEFLGIKSHMALNRAIATNLPYRGYIWKSANCFTKEELSHLN